MIVGSLICSDYLKLGHPSNLCLFLPLTSTPISGARVAEGDLWRQNRTSPWKLCCLPLIVLVDGSIFMVSMVTHNKCYDFIWHRYGGPATKWKPSVCLKFFTSRLCSSHWWKEEHNIFLIAIPLDCLLTFKIILLFYFFVFWKEVIFWQCLFSKVAESQILSSVLHPVNLEVRNLLYPCWDFSSLLGRLWGTLKSLL